MLRFNWFGHQSRLDVPLPAVGLLAPPVTGRLLSSFIKFTPFVDNLSGCSALITKSFQVYLFLQDNKLFFDFGRNLQGIVELITKIYNLSTADASEMMVRL
jgi:hypothetical protein